MFSSIGLIGAGTMGSAVLQAAAKGAPEAALYCSNRTPAKAQALAQQLAARRWITLPWPAPAPSSSWESSPR